MVLSKRREFDKCRTPAGRPGTLAAPQRVEGDSIEAYSAEIETRGLDCYGRVRDEIRAFVERLPGALDSQTVQTL